MVRGGRESQVASRPTLARGVPLKEWRSLLRDRRTRAQALFAPLLMFGMQFVLNPQLTSAITTNPRHAATAAFVVSAFSLTTSAFTVLSSEGPALYGCIAPVSLARSLIQKLWVRGAVSRGSGCSSLPWRGGRRRRLIVPSLPYAALALLGIALYAVIAVGIGTLATDVLEPEPDGACVRAACICSCCWRRYLRRHLRAVDLDEDRAGRAVGSARVRRLAKAARAAAVLARPTEAPPPSITVADGVMRSARRSSCCSRCSRCRSLPPVAHPR